MFLSTSANCLNRYKRDGILEIIDDVSPTPTDDETEGYSVGDLWTNTAAGIVFDLVISLATLAVWRYTTNRAPLTTDNDAAGFGVGMRWRDTSDSNQEYTCASISVGVAVWVAL